MAKVMKSARLDAELSGWAQRYAKQRDTTFAAVLEAALREFREACEGGVPEVRGPSGLEQALGSVSSADTSGPATVEARGGAAPPARSPAPARAPRIPDYMAERQERLRRQMGWDKGGGS